MKKKGLIISTAVMVVVLIAALTTGTFAWFSSSATATIDSIDFSVGAASNVVIGLLKDNKSDSALDKTSPSSYVSGDVTYSYSTSATWSGDNILGPNINAGLSLDVTAGVGSSSDTSNMDKTYTRPDKAQDLRKANGDNYEGLGSLEEVEVNAESCDVIDLEMGIMASKDNISKTYGKITVAIPADQTYIGMAAALRVEITVGSKSYGTTGDNGGDIFNLISAKYDTAAATATKRIAGDGEFNGMSTFVFYFMINDSEAASKTVVTPFSIRIFTCGYDTDCCNGATGTSATVKLEFDGGDASLDLSTSQAQWTALTLA